MFTIYADQEFRPYFEAYLTPDAENRRIFPYGEWIGFSFTLLSEAVLSGIFLVLRKGYEERDFRRKLKQAFYFKQEEEIGRILSFVDQITQEKVDQTWRRDVEEEIASLLVRHSTLHLGGFYRFRWLSYRDLREKLLEHAIDEYMLDREYHEYIRFLREFTKGKKEIEEVHLVHMGGRKMILLDKKGTHIRVDRSEQDWTEPIEADALDEETIAFADLIHLLPKRLIIHTKEKEFHIIRTIAQVFADRVSYCTGCLMCEIEKDGVKE